MMVLTLPLKGQHGVGVGDSVPKMVGEEDGEYSKLKEVRMLLIQVLWHENI